MAFALANADWAISRGATVIEESDFFYSDSTAIRINFFPVLIGLAGLGLVSFAAVKMGQASSSQPSRRQAATRNAPH